jgi:hypothetical protein
MLMKIVERGGETYDRQTISYTADCFEERRGDASNDGKAFGCFVDCVEESGSVSFASP